MPVETADDRLYMLADFGEAVTYTPTGGAESSVTAIFDNGYEAVDAGGGVSFAMQQPRLTCRTSDVPNAAEGDAVVVGGVSYKIAIVMPDGTGITELMLEKQ